MTSWWNKLMSSLRGEPGDSAYADERTTPPAADETPVVGPTPQRDAEHQELFDLLSGLIDTVERHITPISGSVGQTAERVDALAAALDGLAAAGRDRARDLANLIERTEANTSTAEYLREFVAGLSAKVESTSEAIASLRASFAEATEDLATSAENTRKLREIVATWPEFSAAQVESLNSFEQRLDAMNQRTASTLDAVGAAARETEALKDAVSELGRNLGAIRQTNTELASQQQELTRHIAGLSKLVSHNAEVGKAVHKAVSGLAQERTNHTDEIRKSIEDACGKISGKVTLALVLSGIAALAAIAAVVLRFVP